MTGGTFSDLSAGTRVFADACSFVSMNSPLFYDGVNSVGLFQGTNLQIRLSASHGVQMSGGTLILNTCDIRKSTGSGVVCIDGCTASLTACDSGFDNGVSGVKCDTESRVLVANDGSFVRGDADNDLDVGGLPLQSYSDFILGEQPNTRFSAAQNSAIYFAPGGMSQVPTILLTAPFPLYILKPSDSVVLVNASTGPASVVLPPLASCAGRTYTIKKVDLGLFTVNIDGSGGIETIDGVSSYPLSVPYESIAVSAGVNLAGLPEWNVVAKV
jgi:hypothetical protein